MYEFIRNTIKWKSDFEGKELTHKNINLSELRQNGNGISKFQFISSQNSIRKCHFST